jgi:hypothetical protein
MSEIIPAGAAIASAVSIAPQASATLPAAETTAVPDPAPEPHRNPAVQRCLQARSQRIQAERRKRGSSEYEAEGCGGEAYRCAMPDLSGLQSIQDFIACVAFGMVIAPDSFRDGPQLLYAAQVAMSSVRCQSKSSSKAG